MSGVKTVNVREAKTHLSRLLERAHAGEEIIIAKAGKPFARLGPLVSPPARVPGRYREQVPKSVLDPLQEEELATWER